MFLFKRHLNDDSSHNRVSRYSKIVSQGANKKNTMSTNKCGLGRSSQGGGFEVEVISIGGGRGIAALPVQFHPREQRMYHPLRLVL